MPLAVSAFWASLGEGLGAGDAEDLCGEESVTTLRTELASEVAWEAIRQCTGAVLCFAQGVCSTGGKPVALPTGTCTVVVMLGRAAG